MNQLRNMKNARPSTKSARRQLRSVTAKFPWTNLWIPVWSMCGLFVHKSLTRSRSILPKLGKIRQEFTVENVPVVNGVRDACHDLLWEKCRVDRGLPVFRLPLQLLFLPNKADEYINNHNYYNFLESHCSMNPPPPDCVITRVITNRIGLHPAVLLYYHIDWNKWYKLSGSSVAKSNVI